MPRKPGILSCAGCFAVLFAVIGTSSLWSADDPPRDTDAYHFVPIEAGGKTTYLRVQNTVDPFHNLKGNSNKYDPEAIISRPSSMADKSFSSGQMAFGKQNTAEANTTFTTRSFHAESSAERSATNLNKTVVTSPANIDQTASGFDRAFATSNSTAIQGKSASFTDVTATEQHRTALLSKGKNEMPAASVYANKPYLGSDATYLRHDLNEMNQSLSRMSDLPNRPLTIDEVRALINHETKPDTNSKPEPDARPFDSIEAKPAPENPSPFRPVEKEADVPSPGMMAAPENSEPLPSK